MKTILEHIDNLANECGYFTTETTVNNHYGCKHPDQEEQDEDYRTGKQHGKCYCFSCPLGHEADEEDFLNHDENPEDMSEGEWIVLEKDWKKQEIEKHYQESKKNYNVEGESHLDYYRSKHPKNYAILKEETE